MVSCDFRSWGFFLSEFRVAWQVMSEVAQCSKVRASVVPLPAFSTLIFCTEIKKCSGVQDYYDYISIYLRLLFQIAQMFLNKIMNGLIASQKQMVLHAFRLHKPRKKTKWTGEDK